MSNGLQRSKDLAAYFGKTLNNIQEDCYKDFFDKFDEQQWANILKACIGRCKFFPTIAELNEMFHPKEDEKDLANEMAGTIFECAPKFGMYNAYEAAQFLGPEAWRAVELFGGWQELCMSDSDQRATLRAQLRDICKSVLSIKKRNPVNAEKLPMQFQKNNVYKLYEQLKQYSNNLKGISNDH